MHSSHTGPPALVDLPAVLLQDLLRPRLPHTGTRQVAEEVGLGVARQRDDRSALVAHPASALEEPRRRPGELVLVAVLDQRPPDVRIAIGEVDVGCARAIGGTRDRAHDVDVLDVAAEIDDLPRLHVRADPDDEIGVALDAAVLHSCHCSPRMIGTASPEAVRPSTWSSGPPTMKSVCTVATFMPFPGSSSKVSGTPKP